MKLVGESASGVDAGEYAEGIVKIIGRECACEIFINAVLYFRFK